MVYYCYYYYYYYKKLKLLYLDSTLLPSQISFRVNSQNKNCIRNIIVLRAVLGSAWECRILHDIFR
jgi:hypothetical protein